MDFLKLQFLDKTWVFDCVLALLFKSLTSIYHLCLILRCLIDKQKYLYHEILVNNNLVMNDFKKSNECN